MIPRISKQQYYLDIALAVSRRGTCLRRNYGAIIVKNDIIVATGYTGAPRGRENCCDIGYCKREELNIPSGERYELCRSVHAEANAILSASKEEMYEATMYINGFDAKTGMPLVHLNHIIKPCMMCQRLIINANINMIITPNSTYFLEYFVNNE